MIGFLMDPLSTVKPQKDTSYAFMKAAHRKGYKVIHIAPGNISFIENEWVIQGTQVTPNDAFTPPFETFSPASFKASLFNAIFIRTDPPFNERYLMDTWILEQFPKSVKLFNAPQGIRTVNEKVWALQFSDLIPTTLLTRSKTLYTEFLKKHQHIIAKPTNAFGGSSVFKINHGDSNASVIFESLSHNETQEVIVQAYVEAASVGDKRILLLNGEPLGAILRVHASGDHRNNFFAGGTAHATQITPKDLEIIAVLKPHLLALGLAFVGIDIIGDKLIEVNVTSPTCLQEMNRAYNVCLEDRVIETLVGNHHSLNHPI